MSRIIIKQPEKYEMCPVGYHVVRGHQRICGSGTRTWVDAHNAKNPKRTKSALLADNIHYLYWNAELEDYELDVAIQFWIDYWKAQGLKFPSDFDPLVVKAIIAIESSFNQSAASRISTATGLTQVTNTTRRELSGQKRKADRLVKDQIVSVSKVDLKNPVINIAAGTKWLAVKFGAIPTENTRNTYNMLRAYNQWNEKGDAYAKKVLQLFEQSK
jgi:soluble lytic murein transglycosylase-like protein